MISNATSMRRSRGFSLIEVMVSVGVLSVALLGTAGLMASSLRNTNTAYYRSQATILADDILDRMRANINAARTGQYAIDPYAPGTEPTFAPSATGVALYDCTEWTMMLADALPDGVGVIETAPGGEVTIEIRWDNGESSFTTVSHLGGTP
ncbi:type IV pilus assembly protein PilV [Povalibacter uvarum]|uniref:Type IV pilus assembly protein PilV n=1 Tax=Povalibacter uvarum TaxID=732238 RepID=A0A841HGE9_9GAMM|nr:type IV pilus modification protein PilV [Povalibacter uvarum]MBB6091846.1 type IV pilus assembly protein PilV [Povalibacter uvarum]